MHCFINLQKVLASHELLAIKVSLVWLSLQRQQLRQGALYLLQLHQCTASCIAQMCQTGQCNLQSAAHSRSRTPANMVLGNSAVLLQLQISIYHLPMSQSSCDNASGTVNRTNNQPNSNSHIVPYQHTMKQLCTHSHWMHKHAGCLHCKWPLP